MQTLIFDLDHTIFDSNQVLHEGAAELLTILSNLGLKIGGLSNKDHRVLVRLDEAGIRHHFVEVLCNAHHETPKSVEAFHRLVQQLGAELHSTAMISHAHADILLGKDAGVAKTIGVSHGMDNVSPLREAQADHIVSNIPEVLDVLE